MQTTLVRAIVTGIVVFSAFILAPGGCAAPHRGPAVPLALIDQAVIPGIPGARIPNDINDPAFTKKLADMVETRRVRLGLAQGERVPDVSFLALSGGGQDGAYGAGILCAWTARGDRPKFTLVTGISTGALIAPFAFLGPEYDHVLEKMYTTTHVKDIMKKRGTLAGFFGDAMADSAPLRKQIADTIGQKEKEAIAREYALGRMLLVATTNLDSGRPVIWDLGEIASSSDPGALDLMRNVLLASASIPAAFPPVMFDVEAGGKHYEELHCDGGAAAQVFIYPAQFNLRDFSQNTEVNVHRSLYVIRNSQLSPAIEPTKRETMAIAGRSIDSLIRTQGVGDLYRMYLQAVRDGMKFNLAYIPGDFALKAKSMFDPAYMKPLFDLGFERTKNGTVWESAPPGFEGVTIVPK